MIWTVSSNCWKPTFAGTYKEQSHHASYTTQICRISYRQRAQYNSDDERCCEQLLKSHFLLTHLSPVMLQQLIKDPLFKWPTIQKFGHELHRLLKSWISQGHQKHKKAADLRRSTPLLRNGVFLRPTLKKFTVQRTALKFQEYATEIKTI